MTIRPLTVRLPPAERTALENLSKIRGQPMNQLIVAAVKRLLRQQSTEEREIENRLAKLKAYRKRDPRFEKAIAAFIEAEVKNEDPLEENLVVEQDVEVQTGAECGPVQNQIHRLLNA